MHRVLELELEQTNNEITITIINMGRKFRGLGPHLKQWFHVKIKDPSSRRRSTVLKLFYFTRGSIIE